jgi:hypothetical protein
LTDITNRELERRFDEAGISRRLLYPLWYRLVGTLGIHCRPPVTFGFTQHVWIGSTLVLAVIAVLTVPLWLVGQLPRNGLIPTTVFLLVVNPLIGWMRYRAIRRRIGL